MKCRSPSALRGICFLTVTGIVSQVIGFVYRIALAQRAGAEIVGLYQLVLPVFSVLLSLSSIGLTAAVSNLSARFQAVGNFRAIYQLRELALRLFFLLILLPCGILLLYSDGISVFLLGDARTRLGLLLLIPCLALTGIENLQKYYFYGIGRVHPPALAELAEQILRSITILALLFYFPCGAEKTVGLIVLGMVLCEIFSACLQTWLFHRSLGAPTTLAGSCFPNRTLLRRVAAIAVPVGLTALLGNLLGGANSVLIPQLLVRSGMEISEAISSFGVLFGMTLPLLLLPTAFLNALGLVLVPKLAEAAALGRMELVRGRIRRALAAANLLLLPALALLAVLGGDLGELLYHDPRVGDHLPLLAVGVLFSSWQVLFASALNGLNRQAAAAKIALLGDVLQLVVTLLTVGNPAFGLGGFAWGFCLSSAVGAWLTWRDVSRETSLKLPLFDCFTAPLLAATLSAACTRLLATILHNSGVTVPHGIAVSLLFGLVLYLSALQAQGVSCRRLLGFSCKTGAPRAGGK